MKWPSAGSGTEARHAQCPTKRLQIQRSQQALDHVPRHSGASIDRVHGFSAFCKKCKKRTLPLRDKLKTLERGAEGLFIGRIANPPGHKRTSGKFLVDVFGGSGFVAKAIHHLGLRGYVLETQSLVPGVT